MSVNSDPQGMGNSKLKLGPFTIAAILLAAISIFSMLQRLFEFGLNHVIADTVGYYRQIGDALLGWVPEFLNLPFPHIYPDLWTISLISSGVVVRVMPMLTFRPLPREYYRTEEDYMDAVASKDKMSMDLAQPKVQAIFVALFGMSGIGLLLSVALIFNPLMLLIGEILRLWKGTPIYPDLLDMREMTVAFAFQLALVAGFLIIIFAINAYGPSVG